MRVLWCWRCRMDVPMLLDDEWAVVMRAHDASHDDPAAAIAILDEEARRRGLAPVPPPAADLDGIARRLYHLVAGYTLFTGFRETNPNAVWHHVASQYGPPCEHCGKPLRTPRAKWCPACGGWRSVAPS
jgi:hypothetical protein